MVIAFCILDSSFLTAQCLYIAPRFQKLDKVTKFLGTTENKLRDKFSLQPLWFKIQSRRVDIIVFCCGRLTFVKYLKFIVSGWSKQASKHTHVSNAVTLVWGSLRLTPTNSSYSWGRGGVYCLDWTCNASVRKAYEFLGKIHS